MRTSAPIYYHVADRELRNVWMLPFDWHMGDCGPVVRLVLDREALAFIEDCIRQQASRDGMAGEIQAVRERVDRIIAGELETARGEERVAANVVAEVLERYGLKS